MSLSQPPSGGSLVKAVEMRTGKELLDVAMIHRFLTEDSYWVKGIGFELVDNLCTHKSASLNVFALMSQLVTTSQGTHLPRFT